MDRSQKLALAVFTMGIVVGVAILVISGTELSSVQQVPFRAAPGKQLGSARVFVTETAQEAAVPTRPGEPEAETPARTVRARPAFDKSVPSTPLAETLSPVDQAIWEARHTFEPWTGVDRIRELLRTLENLGKASELYAAQAELFLRMDPPELAKAQEAALESVNYASTREERDRARWTEAEVAQRSGEVERAWELASGLASEEGPVSEGKLRAALLTATLARNREGSAAAETAYRDVMRLAVTAGNLSDPHCTDVYRQAAWNLVHLLRESDRRDEADAVAEEAARHLELSHGPLLE
ncbi:MAG: hypothetical protein ACOX5J_15535 [Candidatus Hydrogenedentales bacterium]|jgi:hypothetical protein